MRSSFAAAWKGGVLGGETICPTGGLGGPSRRAGETCELALPLADQRVPVIVRSSVARSRWRALRPSPRSG